MWTFYGASRYGPRIFLNYDANPLVAQTKGAYGQLDLTWTTPIGDWSVIRLVRNSFGVPVNQDDGAVLVDSASGPAQPAGSRAAPVRAFTDIGLTPGSFQYYAVWVYVPSVDEWTRAALTTALVLKDYGYSDRLWELTPSIFRNRSTNPLDPGDNDDLRAFERVFGTGLDGIRGEYETLLNVNDPDKVSGNLLPLMAQQYGQFFEPELGMQQMRRLLRETVGLYRNKGTIPGITGFVSAVTGYGADVLPLKNLVLDYNDSSFEESIGAWVSSDTTLSRYVADATIDAPSPLNDMRRVGILKAVATTSAMALFSCPLVDVKLKGIPVEAGTAYSASFYSRADSTTTTVRVDVQWYDIAGTYLSDSTGTYAANAAGVWTRFSILNMTAPANAARCRLVLRATGTMTAGDVHYFDAVQLEAGATATDYEDARLIDIVTVAPRINEVTNPNFELDTTGWTAGTGTALARSTVTPFIGTGRLEVTPTAGQEGSASSIFGTVSGSDYLVSLHVRGPAGTYTLQGVAHTVPADIWTRISAPIIAAGTATTLTISGPVSGTFGVDAVLAEAGVNLKPYFDGSTYQSVGDTIWEGTAHASRSHFYPQRRAKNFRVASLLPEYTPMGSSFRVLYAQP